MRKNTKKIGQVTVFIYPEGRKFVGVCLELDIVKEHNNIDILRHSIREAVEGHVEAVIKNNLSDDLLNRPAPKKYQDKFLNYLKQKSERVKTKRLSRAPNYSEVITLPLPCGFCYV